MVTPAAPPEPAEWVDLRKANRLAVAAEPAVMPAPEPAAPIQAFLVVGPRLVAGVERGGIVELEAGPATSALIEAGHIVPA